MDPNARPRKGAVAREDEESVVVPTRYRRVPQASAHRPAPAPRCVRLANGSIGADDDGTAQPSPVDLPSVTRSAVVAFLALHTLVVWLGFALRIDQFPLSWAPLYSTQGQQETAPPDEKPLEVVLQDKKWLRDHGWEVETRAGRRESIPLERVNVPMRSMWRLYYERTFGKSPPKYSQQVAGDPILDEWLHDRAPGLRFRRPDFERRLFASLNKTLARTPDSPDFIVKILAERWRAELDPDDFSERTRSKETAELRFREEWREDWR